MRQAINGSSGGAPFSGAIVAEGRVVFLAGRGPLRSGDYVEGTIEEETRLTLENLGALLERAGSGFEHVVSCAVWLTDLSDVAGMNSVYVSVFPDPKPARATVRADLIVGKVEIDCIAVVPCGPPVAPTGF